MEQNSQSPNQEASSGQEKTLSTQKPLEDLKNEAQQELSQKPLNSSQPDEGSNEIDPSNLLSQEELKNSQETSQMEEPLFANVDGEKVEEIILDPEKEEDSEHFLHHKIEEVLTEEEVAALEEQLEGIDDVLRSLMSKYKLTMYLLVGCIVVYLLFLFVFRPSWATYVVITTCIIMLVLAVVNTKISKKIQKLASTRKTVRQSLEKLTQDEEGNLDSSPQELKEEAIVANATSLNDLPKQYTVLDDVSFQDGKTAPHVIVSPYGIAVVGDEHLKEEIQANLDLLDISSPIFFYDPTTEIAALVENIQMEKQIVLDEDQIYTVLKQFIGL